MDRKKLVLVGNGMAGIRTIEHLLKLAPEAYEMTIFGSEPHPNYNRIMLSSVLVSGADMSEVILNDWSWYEDIGSACTRGTRLRGSIRWRGKCIRTKGQPPITTF